MAVPFQGARHARAILLDKEHPDLAVQLHRQAIAREPRNARFAYVSGVALNTEGKQQAAIAELRRSIELDPSAPDPYRKLNEIYLKMGLPVLGKHALAEYLKVMSRSISQRLSQ